MQGNPVSTINFGLNNRNRHLRRCLFFSYQSIAVGDERPATFNVGDRRFGWRKAPNVKNIKILTVD